MLEFQVTLQNTSKLPVKGGKKSFTLPEKKIQRHWPFAEEGMAVALVDKEGNSVGAGVLGAKRGNFVRMVHAEVDMGPQERATFGIMPVQGEERERYVPGDIFYDLTHDATRCPSFVSSKEKPEGEKVTAYKILEDDQHRKVLMLYGRVADGQACQYHFFYLDGDESLIDYGFMLVFSDTSEGSASTLKFDDGFWLRLPKFAGMVSLEMLAAQNGLGTDGLIDDGGDHWLLPLHNSTWLGDGQAMCWFGQILTSADNQASVIDFFTGRIEGAATPLTWHGYWGPGKEIPWPTPEMNTNPGKMLQIARDEETRFQAMLSAQTLNKQGYFFKPVFGNNPRPRDTGAQNDFAGGTGGANYHLIPNGDPLHMRRLRFSMQREGFYRPTHFRERDCSRVTEEKHPNLVFYDERPHFHPVVSPDRLGKALGTSFQFNGPAGLCGHDEEHDSMNHLFTLFALEGRYEIEESIRDRAEDYLLSRTIKDGWSTSGHGPMRTFRQEQVAALCEWCVDDLRLLKRYMTRFDRLYAPLLDEGTPCLDLGIDKDGDGRMLGQGVAHDPAWEVGISLAGPAFMAAQLFERGYLDHTARTKGLLRKMLEKALRDGVTKLDDGGFAVVKAVEWKGANAVPDSDFRRSIDTHRHLLDWMIPVARLGESMMPPGSERDTAISLFLQLAKRWSSRPLNRDSLYNSLGEWWNINPFMDLDKIDPVDQDDDILPQPID